MTARCLAVLMLASGLFGAQAKADLYEYIKKPEPRFAWKIKGQRELLGAKLYELELTSQVWQTIPWTHDLVVLVPPKVEPTATLFLYNQGGAASPRSLGMAHALAAKMKAPVAFLYGIPNQPLFGDLKEDALIAETFVRYLDTKDEDWPLLFPMAKSLVKAMDALQAFSKQEFKKDVTGFVVAGGSKRGWTTWLTAASDSRVKAIIPIVIDTLNMSRQMDHQLESYGAYSRMIDDYTKRKLVPMPKTPEAERLWQMVDPWHHRQRVKVPKLILNGTNDPYWNQDALNLYWDDLVGEKWICYVPNAGHDLQQKMAGGGTDFSRAINDMAAFGRAHIQGKKLPKLTWKHADTGERHLVSVTSDVAPKAARLWTADAPTRDFRKAAWSEKEVKLGRGGVEAEIAGPESGCRVFFVECEYDLDGLHYYLSTQLRIVGKPAK